MREGERSQGEEQYKERDERELRPKMDKRLQKILVVGIIADAAQSWGTQTLF